MKAASLSELKKELLRLPPADVLDYCMHLAKFKKENKELLTYLLFESDDEQAFVRNVTELMDEMFLEVNQWSIYLAKKTIRKILRIANKYIKFSGSKQTEVELLIHFCKKLKTSGIKLQSSTALSNIYDRQIQKVNQALAKMHEDLQFDYLEELKKLV